MRVSKTRAGPRREILRQIERLEQLPLRPASARFLLSETSDSSERAATYPHRARSVLELDPGWALLDSRSEGALERLGAIVDSPWWPVAANDLMTRLWRHSVAVSLAARRIAVEANDVDPHRAARAGLLHGLGLWIVGAVDLELLGRRLAITEPGQARSFEVEELGLDWGELGRETAERWGADSLVADAAWLHADRDRGLEHAASVPAGLTLIQEAFRLAEQTPWSSRANARDRLPSDPRIKLLVAEVQSRCSGGFVEADATPREERLTRSNAQLQIQVEALSAGQTARDQLLDALAGSETKESPESWAERVGMVWCQTAGVSAARVDWFEPETVAGTPDRPPASEVSLTDQPEGYPRVRLWTDLETDPKAVVPFEILPAWRAWAALIADRARIEQRLADVLGALRTRAESEEPRLRLAKLNALAEFAAGAGHELNNPLAVIVGRAQLLLVGETDPKAIRGIRAILTQAQRTHRILRDLMYVARPPELRPRFCQPDDIIRASIRDASTEAEERGVKLAFEPSTGSLGTKVWADPDGLRHLADSLLRNALEATPRGGAIRVCAEGDARNLRWSWHDRGEGIAPNHGPHLFDPFYSGRAAGRGLGMGLPRASRFVEAAGGQIHWQSTPGLGSTFEVQIPLEEPPPLIEPQASLPRG